ncbi:MAG: ATP-binding cassette domain-containing protein [Lysobacterales bacterium]
MSPLLTIDHLRFGWHPDQILLDLEHLHLEAGETLLLRGASGSGKSTLLNLIGGVLVPASGSIRLLGKALETLRPAQRDRLRADHVGYIFQQFNLLPYLDAKSNVDLACGFSRRRRERSSAAGALKAEQLLQRLQLDPAELAGRPASTLSVGQQQRVAAARALIGAPELVIADEPTSALDSDSRDQFLTLLFEECRRVGAALLFVSHDRSLEAQFDRRIELSAINRARPG